MLKSKDKKCRQIKKGNERHQELKLAYEESKKVLEKEQSQKGTGTVSNTVGEILSHRGRYLFNTSVMITKGELYASLIRAKSKYCCNHNLPF